MLRLLLSLSLLSASVSSAALSLEQAVAHAVDSNPKVLRQYARFKAALHDTGSARADYYPQVYLNAGMGYEDVEYKSGNLIDHYQNQREDGSVTVSQLLFNGFKTRSDVKRLSQEAEAERLTLISETEDIAFEVCAIYTELEQSQQLVLLSERNLEEHQKIYDDVKNKVDRGVSSRSDLAQIMSRLSSSQSALLISRRKLFDLQARFFSLVGLNPENLIAPVIDSKLLPQSLEQAIDYAKANHPQIQAAVADMNAVNEELRASNSDYYPTISIDAEMYHNDDIGGFDGHDNGSRIMVNMRYNLFNGFKTTNRAKASGWRYQEAHAIKDQATIQAVELTKLSWNAMTFLKQQEDVLRVNVDAAVATDDGYSKQFKINRRSLLDVLDAKVEVYLARKNYLTTRYDRVMAEYRLANALGILMYSLRIDYPEQWKNSEEKG